MRRSGDMWGQGAELCKLVASTKELDGLHQVKAVVPHQQLFIVLAALVAGVSTVND